MALRGGRYEILGTIATGGMATVHLARALGAGGFERLVAVKTMHPHLAREPEFVAMFLDEARLAARIRHPNVVATMDVQSDDDGLFLVMEYVEGPSVSRLLKAIAAARRDPSVAASGAPDRLPIDVTLRIFLDTLAGLHAAHELLGPDGEPLHLIHRDMSPHNILVGADGIARITDFGVARAESRLASTRTGSVKGKVSYMAPEQVRSEPIDRRSDIYAAGAVLWEMLVGERLVQADNDLAAMRMIMEAERRAPHELEPSVPVAISTACMHALLADPKERYPTAAAFAEALETAASKSGITVAAPRAVAQLIRTLGVHKNAALLAAQDAAPKSRQSSLSPGPLSGSSSDAAPPASRAGSSGSGSLPSQSSAPSGAAVAATGLVRMDATPPSIGTHAAFIAQAPPPVRRRAAPFVLAGAATMLGAAIAIFWVSQTKAPAGDPAPISASPPDSAPSSPSLLVAPAPTTSSTETTAASASAAPSAPAAKPAASARSTTAPTATTNPKTFRPKEL